MKICLLLTALILVALAGCSVIQTEKPQDMPFPHPPKPSPIPSPSPTPQAVLLPLPSPVSNIEAIVQADIDGDEDIYMLDFSLGTGKNLTANNSSDSQPAWAPERDKIAFISDRDGNPEVYLMNIDGSGIVRLTETTGAESNPAWSADGKILGFFTHRDGSDDLCLLNIETGERRFLDVFEEGSGGTMTFSPNETEIILGFDKLNQYKNYRLNIEDGSCRDVINHPCPQSSMTWTDNGQALVYVSSAGQENNIWMVYLEDARFIQLTRHEAADLSPSLSPDGTWLLFSSYRHGGENSQLFLVNLEGDPLKNQVYRLTSDDANYSFPQWR